MARTASAAQLSVSSPFLFAVAAPYGFLCLGLTLLAFGLERLGAIPAVALAPLVLAGSLGQLTAGLVELKKDHPFAAVAFIAHGLFWLSLLGMSILPAAGWGEAPQARGMVSYLAMWAVFNFVLLSGAARSGWTIRLVFALMGAFLLLLAGAETGLMPRFPLLAGLGGLAAGAAALWHGATLLLGEALGRAPASQAR